MGFIYSSDPTPLRDQPRPTLGLPYSEMVGAAEPTGIGCVLRRFSHVRQAPVDVSGHGFLLQAEASFCEDRLEGILLEGLWQVGDRARLQCA